MRVNLAALRARDPLNPALARYSTELPTVAWVEETVAALEVRPLTHYGVDPAQAAAIVTKAQASSSMKGNPIALTGEEMLSICLSM